MHLMTGEGLKTMWSSKGLIACIMFPGLMVSIQNGIAATSSAVVVINGTFTIPPCTLVMPAIVQLGEFRNGVRAHSPVEISINCPDATVPTALYAEKMSGALSGGNKKMTMVPQAGSLSGNPALFWLAYGSGYIALDGGGATDVNRAFCQGSGSVRTCTLTPYTQVFTNTTREQVSATVRFNVMYP